MGATNRSAVTGGCHPGWIRIPMRGRCPLFFRGALLVILPPWLGGLGRRWAAMNQLSLAPPGAGYTNAESWHAQLGELAGPMLQPGWIHDRVACRTGHAMMRYEVSVVQRL